MAKNLCWRFRLNFFLFLKTFFSLQNAGCNASTALRRSSRASPTTFVKRLNGALKTQSTIRVYRMISLCFFFHWKDKCHLAAIQSIGTDSKCMK